MSQFWKNVLLCGVLIPSLGMSLYGQEIVTKEERILRQLASDYLYFEDFNSALKIYHELDTLRPDNPEYTFGIGLCTFYSRDKPTSLLHFLNALKLGYQEPEIYYYLGLAYRFNYDLDNAVYYLNKFKNQRDSTVNQDSYQDVNSLLEQIEKSRKLIDRRMSVDLRNVGEVVNSPYPDYVPITLGNDSVLLFTSRRPGYSDRKSHDGHPYEDIFMSLRDDSGQWTSPVRFQGFNGKKHDAVAASNVTENLIFIYKAARHGNIYSSSRNQKGEWSRPKPVKGINSKFWEGSVYLTGSEDTLYFSSDRRGGYGGSDLYLATKNQRGRWGNVQNLGPSVNTPFDEDSPYMHKNGKTFFFSSRGHNSLGGYDVFSIKLDKGMQWSGLKNLGFPINTIDDDIYFQLNSSGAIGYFTSHRHSNFQQQSVGEKDLFQIVRPNSSPVFFVFKGRVYNSETEEPLPAIVTLKDLSDSTAADQQLLADINTGKFRYDLKFDNRYKLTVEVGDKIYYSQELLYPYQPDLFETFIDLPLRDIPNFQMKLQDVIRELPEQQKEVRLDPDKKPTLVLIRKIPYGDDELKQLLISDRIPLSFRKKLINQLQNTEYLDEKEEGEMTKQLLADEVEDGIPTIFAKLENEVPVEIQRVDTRSILKKNDALTSKNDSTTWTELSDDERRMVDRMVGSILSGARNTQREVVDQLYYSSLNPEEVDAFNRMVARRVTQEAKDRPSDDSDSILANLYESIDRARDKLIANQKGIRTSTNESWGLLHTIEVNGFRHRESDRMVVLGKVRHRANGEGAGGRRLILTDDRGMIYSQVVTSDSGEVKFSNLPPGSRYHILIDDYSIAILGRSRFEFIEELVEPENEDYLAFYNGLTPEQRRRVDRIIARQSINQHYSSNPLHQVEDPQNLERLDPKEQDFIKRLKRYLQSEHMTETDFYVHKSDASRYHQTEFDVRRSYNRFIGSEIMLTKGDSSFYDSLQEKERGFIARLREYRQQRNELVGEFEIARNEADYWCILDEVSTHINDNTADAVRLSARVISRTGRQLSKYQIALSDEFNQIVAFAETDSSGRFSMDALQPNRKFKVLVATNNNLAEIRDLQLIDVRIERGLKDLYRELTPTQKRMVDRIIATMLANEVYQRNAELLKSDDQDYKQLAPEEKEFLERLARHLFADTVTVENLHLAQRDNSYYYSQLTKNERDFVNRLLVKMKAETKPEDGSFDLKEQDKIFYTSLSEHQRNSIEQLKVQRRARSDIFAENPILSIEKVWIALDSIDGTGFKSQPINVSARIVRSDKTPVAEVTVMLAGDEGVISRIRTNTNGEFRFEGVSIDGISYLLAEGVRNLFRHNDWTLENLRVEVITEGEPVIIDYNRKSDGLIVYFEFDSEKLTPTAVQKLLLWLTVNQLLQKDQLIIIDGHTDATGPSYYNKLLSERRGTAVARFLVKQGVSRKALRIIANGEDAPRYFGNEASMNRRVEIRCGN